MYIIFLDIDGVLINRKYASRNKADPQCVKFLNEITDRTGAKIVLSTSWRYRGLDRMKEILEGWGVTGDIIDVTPDFPEYSRRYEIEKWLEKVVGETLDFSWDGKIIHSFVIIDDELDAHIQSSWGVRPSFEYGLTQTDADRAIAILEGYL